jgi:hypothetical protein
MLRRAIFAVCLVTLSAFGSVPEAMAGPAPGAQCSATVATNCYHCTNNSNPANNDPSKCDPTFAPGWSWQHCDVWVNGNGCAAQFPPPHYKGGCRVSSLNDTTPDGTLGGQSVWNGQVNVVVVANTPGDTISATCSIKVNGVDQGIVLTANTPGVGFAAAADRVTFTAAVTDVVSLCTNVTTGSGGDESSCADLTTTPICPAQACGDGGLLDQAFAILDGVIHDVNEVAKIVDPTLCAALKSISGTVNGLPTSGVLYIDPSTGDTFVGGTTDADLFWDCPPYRP